MSRPTFFADLFCRPFLRAFADVCQPLPTFSTQQLPAYIEALLAFANLLLPTFTTSLCRSLLPASLAGFCQRIPSVC
jgi:hypothetical protein